jgi:hypothetical protein
MTPEQKEAIRVEIAALRADMTALRRLCYGPKILGKPIRLGGDVVPALVSYPLRGSAADISGLSHILVGGGGGGVTACAPLAGDGGI